MAAASVLVALLALEVAFRIAAARHDARTRRQLAAVRRLPPPAGSQVRLAQIVRLNDNPRIIYELIPGLDVRFLGAPLRTSSAGWRGPERPPAKPATTRRIIGLGDSVMFGWGVSYESCYLARLEQHLNRARPDISWETINTAVPGYNTAIEVETLERRALAYQPDLVILNFVDNDLSLPNFIVMERSYLTLAHSFFLDFVLTRLRGKTAAEEPELRQLPRAARRVRFDDDPRWVPERYRDMVGRPAFRNGLERLKRLSLQHHFAVLVLVHPQARDFVAEACRDLDLDLVETYPALEAFGARHDQAQREALVLGPQDPHPSALGHDLIAGVLVEHLQSSGLLQRLAE